MSLADRFRRLGGGPPPQPARIDEPADVCWRRWIGLSGILAWEVDAEGRFSRVGADALGWVGADLIGRAAVDVAVPTNRAEAARLFHAAAAIQDVELWLRRGDGGLACVVGAAEPLFGVDGAPVGVRGICRDVTEERTGTRALAEVRRRETAIGAVIRAIHDAVDPAEMLAAAAAPLAHGLGAAGATLYRFDDGAFRPRGRFGATLDTAALREVLARLSVDPELIEAEVAGRRVLAVATRYRGGVNGALAAWRRPEDAGWEAVHRSLISEVAVQVGIAVAQLRHHEDLQKVSSTDLLTGLLNRRMFFQSLKTGLARADGRGRPAAMGYVDLDNFKAVNDVHGHQKGDVALQRVADLLRANTGPDDLVARLGGDEFAVYLADRDEAGADAWGQTMMAAAKALLPLSGSAEKPLGLSVGLVIYAPASGETADQLTQRADEAMYSAKRAGKGRVRVVRRA